MEEYELLENKILTEFPNRYPKLFEIFIIFKLFLITILGNIFSNCIEDDYVYYGMIWLWVVNWIASLTILATTFVHNQEYSMTTAFYIVFILQFVCFVIHTIVGHTKN